MSSVVRALLMPAPMSCFPGRELEREPEGMLAVETLGKEGL